MRHRAKLILVLAAALLLSYAISPYYSLWRFAEALRAHDMAALSSRVDFPAVRGSLKQHIREHFLGVLANNKHNQPAQLMTSSGPSPLDLLVDAYVTPEGLAALISNPAPIKNARSLPSLPTFDGDRKNIDWSRAPKDLGYGQERSRAITLRH